MIPAWCWTFAKGLHPGRYGVSLAGAGRLYVNIFLTGYMGTVQ